MGPVRRRLITRASVLWAAFAAAPAWAEVCDKARPGWSRSDGPVTVWTDPIYFLTTPVVLGLVALACLSLLSRKRGFSIPVAILWLLFSFGYAVSRLTSDPSGIREFALAEGCIGPPHLSIAIAAAITAATIWAVFKGPRSQET